jgi:hypothetical protein
LVICCCCSRRCLNCSSHFSPGYVSICHPKKSATIQTFPRWRRRDWLVSKLD